MAHRFSTAIRSVKSMPSVISSLASASGCSYQKNVFIFINWHVWSSHGKVLCMWNQVWKYLLFLGISSPDSERLFHWQRQTSHSIGDASLRPDPSPITASFHSFTPILLYTRPTSVYNCFIKSSLGLKLHCALCLSSKREMQLQLSHHCQALPALQPFWSVCVVNKAVIWTAAYRSSNSCSTSQCL